MALLQVTGKIVGQWVESRRMAAELSLKPFPCQSRWIQVLKRRKKPMLRKSLIAFTAAIVLCAGSQAMAAGFRHATNTPRTPFPRSEEKISHAEIPIANLDGKDLIGKKIYDQQGNFLGKVVGATKERCRQDCIRSTTRDGNQRGSHSREPSKHHWWRYSYVGRI